ncbi:TPA: ead/Ea22-like family protein [Serratia marcescens]|nr:ead/Ea22-like family protein [Serratia marcescens]
MDNKLSELKAAAMAATPGPWISGDDSWSDGDHANISTADRYDSGIINIAQVDGGGSESGFDEPFSTEQQANARYITAANPAVILALLADNEAKDKRIAELERTNQSQDDHINQQQDRIDSLEKTNGDLGRSLGAAEKRLATPVRLKKVDSSNVPYAGDGFNAAVDYCADRVRAAGFTVEGDE